MFRPRRLVGNVIVNMNNNLTASHCFATIEIGPLFLRFGTVLSHVSDSFCV